MKDTIKDIWVNHRNELIKFLEEKGQGIYDEALLGASIEEEKKELIDDACEWMKLNIHNIDEVLIEDFRKTIENKL